MHGAGPEIDPQDFAERPFMTSHSIQGKVGGRSNDLVASFPVPQLVAPVYPQLWSSADNFVPVVTGGEEVVGVRCR